MFLVELVMQGVRGVRDLVPPPVPERLQFRCCRQRVGEDHRPWTPCCACSSRAISRG